MRTSANKARRNRQRQLFLEKLDDRLLLTAGDLDPTFGPPPEYMPYISEDFASPIRTNGAAQVVDGQLYLTTTGPYQGGTAWFEQQLSIDHFRASFDFEISQQGGIAWGDGLTFAVIDAAENHDRSIGTIGGGLGYLGLSGLAIEIDTYHNPEYGDPAYHHVGVNLDGNVRSYATTRLPFSVVEAGRLRLDIELHDRLLNVSIASATASADLFRNLLLPANVHPDVGRVGFTAATGHAYQTVKVDNFFLDIEPPQSVRSVTNPANGHTYHLLTAPDGTAGITWSEAEAASVDLGGHLVTINDAAENQWIAQTFIGTYFPWIGFSDAANEGQFAWSSGQPVTYTNWWPGEPNNAGGNEDYAYMYNWSAGQYKWNDIGDRVLQQSDWPTRGIAEVEPPPQPDIIATDATTTHFSSFNINYEISEADAPAFIFRAYISADDVFDPGTSGGTDLPLGQLGISSSSDRSVGEHETTLTLTSRAPINDDHRFVLIVADPDNAIEETDEQNNATFSIPLFVNGEQMNRNGEKALTGFGETEDSASGAFTGAILRGSDDFNALTKLDSVWPSGFLCNGDGGPGCNTEIEPWQKEEDHLAQPFVHDEVARLVELIATDHAKTQSWPASTFLSINEAYDSMGAHSPGSLHYEGRGLDFDTPNDKLGRLSGLSWLAGFDWVEFENTHVHVSEKFPDGVSTSPSQTSLQQAIDGAVNLGRIDNNGVANSLRSKLNGFEEALTEGRIAAARGKLIAFRNHVQAQRGTHIVEQGSDNWVNVLMQNIDELLLSLTLT